MVDLMMRSFEKRYALIWLHFENNVLAVELGAEVFVGCGSDLRKVDNVIIVTFIAGRFVVDFFQRLRKGPIISRSNRFITSWW